MLGNNEKIQGVSIPDLFSAMLAELPWRVLHKYITDNAQLMKICTLGGHRVDPQQRPRLMRQVQNEAERNNYSDATCNALFAVWYPVHEKLHEKLETYFKSEEYKAYRAEHKLTEEDYVLSDEKFSQFYESGEGKAWKILLAFSPLKFPQSQADQILHPQGASEEVLAQAAQWEKKCGEAEKKAAAAMADLERSRAQQQSLETELRNLKQQLRTQKGEMDALAQKLQSSQAETRRLSGQLSSRTEELNRKAAETAENADRMTGRLQGELSRLKEEVNGWQNKFQEQLQANRQIQHESEVVGARAGKADAEKEEALRKLKESQKFVDLLLSRIEWAKLGSQLKLSPTLRKNFNSMLKRLNYEEDLSLTIEGTLPQFWERLQRGETALVQKIANSNTLEVMNGNMEAFWEEVKDSFDEVQKSLEARVFMIGLIHELLFTVYTPGQLATPTIPAATPKKKSES